MLNEQPTAYVCEHFTCKKPTTSPVELASQLTKRQPAPADIGSGSSPINFSLPRRRDILQANSLSDTKLSPQKPSNS